MKQILYQSKGAEPPADKAPQNTSEHKKKSQNAEGDLHIPLIQHRLERPDGTGPHGSRAGIAVQAGHADVFEPPLVNLSVQEDVDVPVGKNGT